MVLCMVRNSVSRVGGTKWLAARLILEGRDADGCGYHLRLAVNSNAVFCQFVKLFPDILNIFALYANICFKGAFSPALTREGW